MKHKKENGTQAQYLHEVEEGSQKNGLLKETSFEWLEETDPEWFFVVVAKQFIKKGEQLNINYGDRPNRYLMECYGFCPIENKYDSFVFRAPKEAGECSI